MQRNDGRPPPHSGLPTLAVLPFTSDEQAAVLAGGVHEDVCSELTRFRGLRVVSPMSVAKLAGRSDADLRIALGASHVLRGRFRQAAGQLELAVALSETSTGVHVWADRVAADAGEVAHLATPVLERVVATLNARLEEAAHSNALRHSPANLLAYELTVRGLKLLREGTLAADEAARALFEQALEIDPSFPRAHAGIALSWFNEWSCQFSDRFELASQRAYVHAHRALELDDSDAMVHLVLAKMALFRSQWEQASWYLERAVTLCPNDADLLAQASVLEVYLGRPDSAVAHVDAAMQLNPYHPAAYHVLGGFARVFARHLDDAISYFARSDAMPFVDAPAYVALAMAHLGRIEEGRREYQRYVASYREKIAFGAEHPADAPQEWLFQANPFRRVEDVGFLREGIALLGLGTKVPVPRPLRGKHVFARRGDRWLLEYGGQVAELLDLKGLSDVSRLLQNPGQEIEGRGISCERAFGGCCGGLSDQARSIRDVRSSR